MANKRVMRCIHYSQFHDIKKGNCNQDSVSVYYGFDNYDRSATQILELINIVRNEMPGIELDKMNVYEITKAQSDRHAHQTMVQLFVPVDTIRNNIEAYSIL